MLAVDLICAKLRPQCWWFSHISETGMAKAIHTRMNYYEKLVKKINQSMKDNPRSAIAMDMGTFQIVAKSNNLKSLSKKIAGSKKGSSTVVFQKPSQKAAWIL